LLVVILLIAFCVYVAILNPVRVSLVLPFVGRLVDVPLVLVMLFCILFGVVLTAGFVFFREARRSLSGWLAGRRRERKEKVQRLYMRGLDLLASHRYKEARAAFFKVLKVEPKHVGANVALGDIAYEEHNWEEAARYHGQALDCDEYNVRILLKLEKDFCQAGRLDEAIGVLRRIVQTDRKNLAAWSRLRELYFKQGAWSKAAEAQREIVSLTKGLPGRRQAEEEIWLGIRYELAMQLLGQGQEAEAEKGLLEVIKADKKFVPGYVALARIYREKGRRKEALAIVEKGYKVCPSLVLLKELERIRLEEENPEGAIRAYRQAIEKNPEDCALRLFLGMLYLKLEMVDEAKEQFLFLEQQGRDFALLHYVMAEVYKRRKDYERSCQEYRQAFQAQEVAVFHYVCQRCGAEYHEWSGRCQRCNHWNCIGWRI